MLFIIIVLYNKNNYYLFWRFFTIEHPKFTLNTYLNEKLLTTLKANYKEFAGIWALFAFFIILNSVIDFNNTNQEKVNIYQTTQVKIIDTYRDGQLMANGKAPIFYHVSLPTGKKMRIHIENTPTRQQIKTGKNSKLAVTESNPTLRIGSIITLYKVAVVQGGKSTSMVYATNFNTATAQQARLKNTRTKALWHIVFNTIQYLLIDLIIVVGAGILTNYLRKDDNNHPEPPIIANTETAYVQLPK